MTFNAYKQMYTIPAKYENVAKYVTIGLAVFIIIGSIISLTCMNRIKANTKPTALGGYRDDDKASDDEKDAKLTKALVLSFAFSASWVIFFLLFAPRR